ncbi:hypothetical protein BC941DRAFT_70859 [Chlamydoabsidia padenii]|nr:hypothetical protein BC941DRAFT_70859 [Chlamydoabsidia padenii]
MDDNHQHIPFELLELIITHVTDKKDILQCTLVNKVFYAVTNPKLWYSPIHYEDSQLYTAEPVLNSLHLAKSCSQLHPVPLGSHILEELILEEDALENADMNEITYRCP